MSIITPIIQSTNSNIVQSVFGGLLPNISVLRIGDSLQSQMEDLYSAAGQVSFADSYPNSTQNNRAISGSFLTEDAAIADGTATQHWVSSDTVSAGDKYTQMLAGVPDTNAVTHILIDIGNNDGAYVPSDVSEATFKASLIGLYNLLKSDFPNADIIQNFLGRHRNAAITGFTQIRRSQLDSVEETSGVTKGIDIVDLDLFDNVHLTEAGYEEKGRREAILIQNKYDAPNLETANIDYGVVTMNFDKDITAPSSGDGQFAIDQDGTQKTGTITRPSSGVGLFTLDANNGLRFDTTLGVYTNYGRGADLAQTNPDVVDGANGLPPRTNIVTPTTSSVIVNNSDVVEYWHAQYSTKTFGTGSEVTAIEGLKGAGFTSISTNNAVYDATLFGGEGGLKVSGASEAITLAPVNQFTASSTHTLFFVVEYPSTPAGNIATFNFANSGNAADANARLFSNGAAANINYGRDQGGGFPTLQSNGAGNQYVVCLRYNSNSSLDSFFNETTVTTNIDPNDNFSIRENIHLFSRNGITESLQDFAMGAFVGCWGTALTNQEVSDIMNELGTRFGITIS